PENQNLITLLMYGCYCFSVWMYNGRAIMEIVCETSGLVINQGTFWSDFPLDGSSAASDPWHILP
ncbi:MAG: hypothetical protein EA412_14105, partial [Chitinophagaceae bacterium]